MVQPSLREIVSPIDTSSHVLPAPGPAPHSPGAPTALWDRVGPPLAQSTPNLRPHPEAEMEVQRGSPIDAVGRKAVVYLYSATLPKKCVHVYIHKIQVLLFV